MLGQADEELRAASGRPPLTDTRRCEAGSRSQACALATAGKRARCAAPRLARASPGASWRPLSVPGDSWRPAWARLRRSGEQALRLPPRTRARCAVSTTAIENPRCVLQTEPSVQRVHFACSSSAHRPPCGADLRWPCLVRTGNRLFHRMTIAEAIGGRQRRDRLPQQCSRRCSASAGLCECWVQVVCAARFRSGAACGRERRVPRAI